MTVEGEGGPPYGPPLTCGRREAMEVAVAQQQRVRRGSRKCDPRGCLERGVQELQREDAQRDRDLVSESEESSEDGHSLSHYQVRTGHW